MSKLKRLAAPKFWPIERKGKKFVISPNLGPHKKEKCIPLGLILRDILKCAENMKEVKAILNKKIVKIDNRVRTDYRFPVGIFDVLSIDEDNYRVLPSKKGFCFLSIGKDEANIKLLRVENKRNVRGGKNQLNFNDGTNILVEKNGFKTGDTVIFDLNERKILDKLEYKRGSLAMIIGGKNIGKIGTIKDIVTIRGFQANKAIMKINGDVEVPKKYIFVIGRDKPVIRINH